jgi:hypothetical protein
LTDPQATWVARPGMNPFFAYDANYLIDNKVGIMHLAIGVVRKTDPARIAYAFQSRGNVDAIAHQIAVALDDYIAKMNPNPRDPRNPASPVMTTAGKDTHAIAITPANEPEAVVFDLMNPLRP